MRIPCADPQGRTRGKWREWSHRWEWTVDGRKCWEGTQMALVKGFVCMEEEHFFPGYNERAFLKWYSIHSYSLLWHETGTTEKILLPRFLLQASSNSGKNAECPRTRREDQHGQLEEVRMGKGAQNAWTQVSTALLTSTRCSVEP